MKTKVVTVGFLALCQDCDWKCEDYKIAKKEALSHSRYYKHYVCCEEITVFDYDGRGK